MFAVVYPIMLGLLVICIGMSIFNSVKNDALRKNYASSEWSILRILYYFVFGLTSLGTILNSNNDMDKYKSVLSVTLKNHFILFMGTLGVSMVISVSILIYLYQKLEMSYYRELLRYVKKIDEVKEKLSDISSMKQTNTNDLLVNSEKVLQKTYEDLEQSYQAAVLVGTFKTLNDFQITKDTREELLQQLDICESMRKLG